MHYGTSEHFLWTNYQKTPANFMLEGSSFVELCFKEAKGERFMNLRASSEILLSF